ncbi:phage tail domain-containing protein [Streptomyces sp. 8L]|uniref:phage tail domain-containing protein n=1 Tax=Streptomyces sp. 8L TaxID=2877242 RepID=UPI001CD39BF8|nr:phage tail domain-containing protein [Streptomyces sp. 8L]MCA1220247.1 phage tail family protein [Streptomyces sp. 8L]
MADLLDWQYDLAGALMGAGTQVNVIEVSGLGRPPVRDNDTPQPSADGVFPGPDYWDGRQVQFDAAIRTPGDAQAPHDIVAALQAGAQDPTTRLAGGETIPLRIKRPGRPVKVLNGRLRKVDPTYAQVIFGYVPLDIEFLATDPQFYGDEDQTVEIPLGWLSGGGFTAPVSAPIYVTSASVAADRPGWVVNGGDTSAYPVIRIAGPCSNVTVIHAESGRTLALPALSLTAGQWVELDSRPGRVSVLRENGGNAETYLSPASRLDLFTIPPGQSEMRWTANDPTNTSRLRLTWRDAYTAL